MGELTTPKRKRPRHVRHPKRARTMLLEEFRRTGRVDLAATYAGVDRTLHYVWLKDDPEYAAAFEAARSQAVGLLEDEAVRRAYHGTLRPVTVAGTLVMVTEFSDRLLEFLLKCRNRAVFGDQQVVTGKDGAPLFGVEQINEALRRAKSVEDTAATALESGE